MTNVTLTHPVNLEQQSEEALAILAQQGSPEAFDILYERLFTNVYKRVACSVPDRDIEDVTQEIFVAALKSLKNYRGEAKFRTWLRTLVIRQIADYYRLRKSVEADLEISEEPDDDGETSKHIPMESLHLDHPNLDDQIILQQCLRRLPNHYRDVILLRFVEGLQFNEISEVQKMNLEATKSQFRRAIAALQKVLEEIGYEQ